MKSLLCLLLLLCPAVIFAQAVTENYPVDSASVVHAGVPKGEVLHFTFESSKIYPGTYREYWVYVPTQYNPAKPACVFVDQDGIQFKTPTVFDNLINSKEMPVTIGIFIQPGRVRAADTTALDRYNRSFEYDALGDAYARFLLEELLPDVEKHKTSDGRSIVLSKSGNDRCIGGTSSGAICAFTAAWERPDAFSRVFSGIGTYVSLRGGDRYPSLIRKYEPKPIRVFLQDGSHDQNAYGGDWFYANQMMERALTFAGYEVNHIWGEGAHNSNQATAYFPQAMRWLWKAYPAPVKSGATKNPFLNDILEAGEGWELVGQGYGRVSSINAASDGLISFKDLKDNQSYVIDTNGKLFMEATVPRPIVKINGHITKFVNESNVLDKEWLIINHFDQDGNNKKTDYIEGNDLIGIEVLRTSKVLNHYTYATGTNGTKDAGKILRFGSDWKKVIADQGLNAPFGMALTPDHSQLYVTESNSHWVWIYTINPDGSLTNKQRYGNLYVPDTAENAQAKEIKCDRDGRVYVATNMGIQVLDQTGRVNAILPLPLNAGAPVHLCFAGPNFNELYVSCNNKVYRRKLKVKGLNSFDAAVKPIKPRL